MDGVFGYIKELLILLSVIMVLWLSRMIPLNFRDVYLGMKCHDVYTSTCISKNSNK